MKTSQKVTARQFLEYQRDSSLVIEDMVWKRHNLPFGHARLERVWDPCKWGFIAGDRVPRALLRD